MDLKEEAVKKKLTRYGQVYESEEEALRAIGEKREAALRKNLEAALKKQIEDEHELERMIDQLEIQTTAELEVWDGVVERIINEHFRTGRGCIAEFKSGLTVSISPHLREGEARYQEDWIRSNGFLAGDRAIVATKNHEVEVRMLLDDATDNHVIRISKQDAQELDVGDGEKVVLAMGKSTEGKTSSRHLRSDQMLRRQYERPLLALLGIKKRGHRPLRKILVPKQ